MRLVETGVFILVIINSGMRELPTASENS
jgi:hypothetical protein